MTIFEAIKKRRSIRKFKPEAVVTDEQIHQMLEAAMLSPSSGNSRMWEFIVVKDREKLDAIRAAHPYTGMLETASIAIVVIALSHDRFGGYLPHDCGAVTENILLAAVGLGLGACWCGVWPREDLIKATQEVLGIDKLPFCIIAVGEPDENPDPRGQYEESKVTYM